MVTSWRDGNLAWTGVPSRNPHTAEHIMGMPAAVTSWTVEMLDALEDDGQRYEIIDGELFVTPVPSDVHQFIVLEFATRLHAHLRLAGIARTVVSPADVRKPNRTRNRVQPDVFVIRLFDGKRPAYPYALSDLMLAIEVESPSNPELDYRVKRALYLKHGVPEYWVVNPTARIVSRFRTVEDPGEVFNERITWQPDGIPQPLEIDLPALFTDALD